MTVVVVLLNGCATSPEGSLANTPWESRRGELMALQDWTLAGRISVINEAKGWHARMLWVQTDQGYAIDITNPLGQIVARIQGDARGVRVQTSDGRVLTAADPDRLVEQAVGMRIPVSGLRYWVKGLPDPDAPSTLAGDPEGRLTRLQQDGWLIEYAGYSQVAHLELPRKIKARQDDLKVQVIADQWNTRL